MHNSHRYHTPNFHKPKISPFSFLIWFFSFAQYVSLLVYCYFLFLIPQLLNSGSISRRHQAARDHRQSKCHASFPNGCARPCILLRNSTITGGDCFTLFLAAPTCLLIPSDLLMKTMSQYSSSRKFQTPGDRFDSAGLLPEWDYGYISRREYI